MTREYIPNPECDAEYAASTIRPMSGEESLVRIVALERRIAELEKSILEREKAEKAHAIQGADCSSCGRQMGAEHAVGCQLAPKGLIK